jgi:hypothetical protein
MKTIATTWFSEVIPPLHALCLASWMYHGYEAVVYSYRDKIEGLPSGTTLRDGQEILSQEHMDAFMQGRKGFAHFSDIFRMELLNRGLGVWCDADYLMLQPLPICDEIMIGRERNNWPCNAVMWMPPNHPIARGLLENYYRGGLAEWTYIKPRWHALIAKMRGREYTIDDLPNGHWGRHALDYYVRRLKLSNNLLPQDAFFAEETYTGELFEPKPFDRLIDNPEVYGLHLFWKRKQNDAPEAGSFYAWAKEKYGARLN